MLFGFALVEIFKSYRFFNLLNEDLFNQCSGRTLSSPVNHCRERFRISRYYCFDATVTAVAYPTDKTQPLGHTDHVVAETDTLHHAGNDKAARFHCRQLYLTFIPGVAPVSGARM